MFKYFSILLFLFFIVNISFSIETKELIGKWEISLMNNNAVGGNGTLLITRIYKNKIASGILTISYDNAPMMAAVKIEKKPPINYNFFAKIEEVPTFNLTKTYLHFKCFATKGKEKLLFSVLLLDDNKTMNIEDTKSSFQHLVVTKSE